ncbi:lipoprotein [Mycoplasma feriruminatoris]|nr:LppA family lipoprotein [Mycoplasma feriruminatoris]UKS53694.1 lipoprotein [Mycoplasma feriruminatoris]
MKKATKLLLSILPISSIGFLSVVSCSTTKKPDNQNKPNNNNPNPNNSSSGNQTNPNDSTAPNENNTPSQPENQPNNGENGTNIDPKKPEEPKGDDPNAHNYQPPADQPTEHRVDFSDLEKLSKEISFENFTFYKNKDAKTAWNELLVNQERSFKEVIFNKNLDILSKYKINFESDFSNVIFAQEKGTIDNVKIKFTKEKESKIKVFIFTGFKKITNESKDKINNKDNYIKAKTTLDKRITAVYPSLLANMLLYVEDSKKYEEIQLSRNSINFDELKNKNTDLFENDFIGFNIGTKEFLFEYNEKDREKYKDKIVAAKYDDINGELGVEVEITNRKESNITEPLIKKTFSFPRYLKHGLKIFNIITGLFSELYRRQSF